MSEKPASTNAETKETKVEDLPERELTDESADAVKGGITATTVSPATPGLIIPCVRTIKTGGL